MLLLAGLFSLTTASAEPFTLEIDPTSVTSIVVRINAYDLVKEEDAWARHCSMS